MAEPEVLLLQLPVLPHHQPQLAMGGLGLPELPLQSPLYAGNVGPDRAGQRSLVNHLLIF